MLKLGEGLYNKRAHFYLFLLISLMYEMTIIQSAVSSYSCTGVSGNAFLSSFTTIAERSLETSKKTVFLSTVIFCMFGIFSCNTAAEYIV